MDDQRCRTTLHERGTEGGGGGEEGGGGGREEDVHT